METTNSNLKITKKSEQTTATYEKDGYRADITYNVNKTSGNIESLNMSIYGVSNGSYIGNVNANDNGGGELTYNLNGIAEGKLGEVCALVEEVNSAIATSVASEADGE